jgi:hypothetical protein
MWDNFGFNGSAFEVDPGVKNIAAGVAKVVTGATETLASCNISDLANLGDIDFSVLPDSNNNQMLVDHPTKIFLNNLHHTLRCGH